MCLDANELAAWSLGVFLLIRRLLLLQKFLLQTFIISERYYKIVKLHAIRLFFEVVILITVDNVSSYEAMYTRRGRNGQKESFLDCENRLVGLVFRPWEKIFFFRATSVGIVV